MGKLFPVVKRFVMTKQRQRMSCECLGRISERDAGIKNVLEGKLSTLYLGSAVTGCAIEQDSNAFTTAKSAKTFFQVLLVVIFNYRLIQIFLLFRAMQCSFRIFTGLYYDRKTISYTSCFVSELPEKISQTWWF
jgi:hypothetical protein